MATRVGKASVLSGSRGEGQAGEASAGAEEVRADEAFGEAAGWALGRGALAGFDGAAHHTPAKHRVAHGHPERLLGQALAGGAVEGGLGAEVEWRGAGGGHADVELGEQEASGKGVLVRESRHILVWPSASAPRLCAAGEEPKRPSAGLFFLE